MPDSEVSVKFSTKGESDLYKAIVGIATEMNKAVASGDRAANSLGKLDPELRRFASSIKQIQTTPLDRLDEKLTKLHKAFSAGLIDKAGLKAGYETFQADFDAANVKQLTDEEKRAAAEAAKAAAETEKFADSVKKITATPLDRLNERMEKLRSAMKSGAITAPQAKAAESQFKLDFAKESFGNVVRAHAILRAENQKTGESAKTLGIINQQTWAQTVTAVSTASQAIGTVAKAAFNQAKQALQEIRAEADKASRNLGETLKAQGTLAQLGATPAENKGLMRAADALFATGTVETRGQAAEMVKALSNANKMAEIPLFAKMQRSGLVGDAGKFAGMLNTIQTSMGADAGTSQELASMTFMAGTKSFDDVNALIAGAAKAGSAAKGAGKSTSELLAGTAVMSQALGGSDLGGERMKALFEAVEKNRALQGKSLVETLDTIQAKTGGKTDRAAKMLGSSEAMNAFQVLYQNRDDLAKQIGEIENARRQDFASRKMNWLEADPARRAEIFRRSSSAMAELEKERTLGQPAALAQATIDREAANARLGKVTGLQSGIARGFLSGFGASTEGEQGRELSGYVARKAGDIQRTLFGDRQLIAERARGLASDSPERQMIAESLRATNQELDSQRTIQGRFEANKLLGIREAGPLFDRRSEQRADLAGGETEAARQQRQASANQLQASSNMLQAAQLFVQAAQGQQLGAAPVVAPDTSRRAQVQHAIPAE